MELFAQQSPTNSVEQLYVVQTVTSTSTGTVSSRAIRRTFMFHKNSIIVVIGRSAALQIIKAFGWVVYYYYRPGMAGLWKDNVLASPLFASEARTECRQYAVPYSLSGGVQPTPSLQLKPTRLTTYIKLYQYTCM